MAKPVVRSPLRLFLGTLFFRIRRSIIWWKNSNQYAKYRSANLFNDLIFSHSSPILRKLAGVDESLQIGKKKNLEIAISSLEGIVISPGQIFSFWYLVGKPTKSKGFLPGVQLRNGKFFSATGGGLCQMTNLIYWMLLHSPLTVTERWRHSFDVFPDSGRTLPFGSGATCAYNYVDLQFRNDTKQEFQLHFWIQENELFGEIRSSLPVSESYEVYESYHRFQSEPGGGYTRRNQICRKTRIGTKIVSNEVITENVAWVLYEPLLPVAM